MTPFRVGEKVLLEGEIIHIWSNGLVRILLDRGDQVDLRLKAIHRRPKIGRKKRHIVATGGQG